MNTAVLKIQSPTDIPPAVEKARQVILNDGLVAFPTETVYGLAASADSPKALEKLVQLKQRPDEKPFTLHVGRKSDFDKYVPDLSILDRQLIRKALPGPLTIIFKLNPQQIKTIQNTLPAHQIPALYHNSSIGIRLPDNPIAIDLLSALEVPIVAPSANCAGKNPPTNAEDVLQQLDGRFDLLLDGGPTRYAKPSTIVILENNTINIVRPGVLDLRILQNMRSLNILFVCTGNTCRSPMAKGICRHFLAQQLNCPIQDLPSLGIRVDSAGIMAFSSAPAASNAVFACRDKGIDITDHRAQLLTVDLIQQADYVFVMDSDHLQMVLETVPQAAGKTQKLDDPREVADPIGRSLKDYRACAEQIEQAVRNRLRQITGDFPRNSAD